MPREGAKRAAGPPEAGPEKKDGPEAVNREEERDDQRSRR
jgi:hypothetical protein